MSLGRILKHWFTGRDNESYELGRFLWFAGVISTLGFQGFSIAQGHPFDAVQWGTGLGAVLGLGGAGIAFKDGANRSGT